MRCAGRAADLRRSFCINGGFIELQGTGEERPMTRTEVETMMALAEKGCNELFAAQKAALG